MHKTDDKNTNVDIQQPNASIPKDGCGAYKLAEAIGEIEDVYVMEAVQTQPAEFADYKPQEVDGRTIAFPTTTTAAIPQQRATGGIPTIGEVPLPTAGNGVPTPKKKRPVWQKALGIAAAVAVVFIGYQLVASVILFKFSSLGTTFDTATSGVDSSSSGKWSASDMLAAGDAGTAGDSSSSSKINSGMSYMEESAAKKDVAAAEGEGSRVADIVDSEPMSEPPVSPEPRAQDPAEAFMLTAGVWNDNDNWPFFTNLVSGGRIEFPAYGINPTNRIKATVTNDAGEPMRGETVELKEGDNVLWTAKTDKTGTAYLFYQPGQHPTEARCGGSWDTLSISTADESGQGTTSSASAEANIVVGGSSKQVRGIQVAFIVDTTGSMGDELAYLQKDFSSIAQETSGDNVFFSTSFYKDEGDEYVVKSNGFTDDIDTVKSQLSAESASGGGDTPEAVAQVLSEVIADNSAWDDDYAHIAFLIFDAPPHEGAEQQVEAAVRAAAAKGIRVVPVVASNAERDTELFGRALAICTGASYVFLTDDSGIGNSHLDPIIGDYTVEKLHDVIVRLIREQGN